MTLSSKALWELPQQIIDTINCQDSDDADLYNFREIALDQLSVADREFRIEMRSHNIRYWCFYDRVIDCLSEAKSCLQDQDDESAIDFLAQIDDIERDLSDAHYADFE